MRQTTTSRETEPDPASALPVPSAEEALATVSDALVEHLSSLRAFARSLTWNRHQADDLVHDAVLRALAAAHQFTPGTNFKAWVFTILRNLFYNQARRPWARHLSLDDEGALEPSSRADQEDRLAFCDFRRAFHLLAPEHREVLLLVGASGMSYEAAAKLCNCPVGTVKSRVSRGRRELKDLLQSGDLALPRSSFEPVAESDLERLLTSAA